MPKEYINARDFDRTFRDAETGEPGKFVDHTSAKVSWGRDNDNVALSLVDFAADPDGMADGVMHLNLDRLGINRLIRTLRRARDNAFGADA